MSELRWQQVRRAEKVKRRNRAQIRRLFMKHVFVGVVLALLYLGFNPSVLVEKSTAADIASTFVEENFEIKFWFHDLLWHDESNIAQFPLPKEPISSGNTNDNDDTPGYSVLSAHSIKHFGIKLGFGLAAFVIILSGVFLLGCCLRGRRKANNNYNGNKK